MTSPALVRDVLGHVPRTLFIAGHWAPSGSGATFAVENPASGELLAEVADAGPEDAHRAMDACAEAQPGWAATAPRRRSEILMEAWRRVLADEDRLATLMTLEMGKALAESRAEVRYAAEFLRWFAEEAVRLSGDYRIAPEGGSRILTLRQPVGPCVLVTPWNFPLAMGARKIAPALAAGCTVTIKPAHQTPLSTLALAHIFEASGLPAGVLNVVPGLDAGAVVERCLEHPVTRKLSFTGSTAVGRRLARRAGERLLRCSMELGGDNPFLVFADADFDAAIEGALQAKMRNIGQACTAANRFLVEADIADRFADVLATRMAELRLGDGLSGAEVGPLIDARARDRIAAAVEASVQAGARVLTGAVRPSGQGYFYPPTVLTDLPPNAEILGGEIFGPVAVVQAFRSEADAVEMANATTLGLAAYLYTSRIDRALRVMEALQVGMVGVNRGIISNAAAPFGGVKESGLGREGGHEGIEEYLALKYAAIPA